MNYPKSAKLDYENALKWPLIPDEQLSRAAGIVNKDTNTQLEAIKRMEGKFAARFGSPYVLSFNNGTAAIFSAFQALGLPPGSEVLAPSYTYWASVLPMLWAGLAPVFCDIDPETLCISLDDIEKKYSSRTKAILVVHLFGQAADMEKILAFARRHSLKVIEDASQAFGASYRGRQVGTLADVGCFSLQTSKHIPAGEGGLLVTGNSEIYERAICLGFYRRIGELDNPDLSVYKNTGFGFKSRIHPFAAALAVKLLDTADVKLEQVQHTMAAIAAALTESPCFSIPKVVPGVQRSYWARFHVMYKPGKLKGISKSRLIRVFRNAGILLFDEVSKYGSGLHREPFFLELGKSLGIPPSNGEIVFPAFGLLKIFGGVGTFIQKGSDSPKANKLPVTENIEKSDLLTFPVFTNADDDFVEQYTGLIRDTLQKIEKGDKVD